MEKEDMGKYKLNFFENEEPDQQFIQDVMNTFKDQEEYSAYKYFVTYFCKETYDNDDLHAIFLYFHQAINYQRIINEDLQNQINELRIQLHYNNKDK